MSSKTNSSISRESLGAPWPYWKVAGGALRTNALKSSDKFVAVAEAGVGVGMATELVATIGAGAGIARVTVSTGQFGVTGVADV